MPNDKQDWVKPSIVQANRVGAGQLATELRQPLTAASNYIGAARIILGSAQGPHIEAAVRQLDRAGEEILRAGSIVGDIQRELRGS